MVDEDFENFIIEMANTRNENPPSNNYINRENHACIDVIQLTKGVCEQQSFRQDEIIMPTSLNHVLPIVVPHGYVIPLPILFSSFGGYIPFSMSDYQPPIYTPPPHSMVVVALTEYMERESNDFTEEKFKKLFAILSVTGVALKRLLTAMFGVVVESQSMLHGISITVIDDSILWNTPHPYLSNTILTSYEIVSLYAVHNNISLIDSIEKIFEYLEHHEQENSVSSKNCKNYWKHETTPLMNVFFGGVKTILQVFSPQYDCLCWKGIPFQYNVELYFGLDKCSFTFTLWRSKSGMLRWFQKEPPQQDLCLNTDSTHNLKSNLVESLYVNRNDVDCKIEYNLFPLIMKGSEIWLYGPEKSFKSWFTRILAHTLSYGGVFLGKYEAAPELSVLLIDGEMQPKFFFKNCEMELKGLGYENKIKFNYLLARSPKNPTGRIDVLDPVWKSQIDEEISKHDVIILDCYYKLTSNQVKPTAFLDWMAQWKNKDKTFIVVDHANREGDLQGGIDKLRSADLCIELTKQKDSHNIIISFPTTRYLKPEESEPITLKPVFEDEEKFYFEVIETVQAPDKVEDSIKCCMIAYILTTDHKLRKNHDIHPLFGVSESTIYEWCKKASNYSWNSHEQLQFETYKKMALEDLKKEAEALKK